jgi:hypothetical protein
MGLTKVFDAASDFNRGILVSECSESRAGEADFMYTLQCDNVSASAATDKTLLHLLVNLIYMQI